MLSHVALVLLTLANGGYWIGEQTAQVQLTWRLEEAAPEAELVWELMVGHARVGQGRTMLQADRPEHSISVTPPKVRTRTEMTWVYTLVDAQTREEVAQGQEAVVVFPNDLLAPVKGRMDAASLYVWDDPEGLPQVLEEAEIAHTAIRQGGQLAMRSPRIILVGENQLRAGELSQAALLGQARSGASVMVFRQTRSERVADYALVPRTAPSAGEEGEPALEFRRRHPLLQPFEQADLPSLTRPLEGDRLHAIRLPVDEPALEVVFWPAEVTSGEPRPIDALLVTRRVGAGRVVLCQLPLGRWESDPRAQLLLAASVDYLLTRPEHTPAPSRRFKLTEPAAEPDHVIEIPSGASR